MKSLHSILNYILQVKHSILTYDKHFCTSFMFVEKWISKKYTKKTKFTPIIIIFTNTTSIGSYYR